MKTAGIIINVVKLTISNQVRRHEFLLALELQDIV